MVEEMTAYMRVSLCEWVTLWADVRISDKVEIDALDSSPAVVNAAQEWNAQRVSILINAQTTQW
jgi:hypothetical protein